MSTPSNSELLRSNSGFRECLAFAVSLFITMVVFVVGDSLEQERHANSANGVRVRFGVGGVTGESFMATNRWFVQTAWQTNDDFSVTLKFKTNQLW